MVVRVVPLESGRLLVNWSSMEKELPNCVNYEIVVVFDDGSEKRVALVNAEKKKEYSAIINVGEEATSLILQNKLFIKVIALAPRNIRTNVAEIAVHQ